MPDHEEIRADLLEAMGHLKDAHTALLADDLRPAIIKLEIAQAALSEVRRQLPAGVHGYDNKQT